jgi:hypothetical protein
MEMVIHHIDMVILDMGDDSIDTVFLEIDMGYLDTLPAKPAC